MAAQEDDIVLQQELVDKTEWEVAAGVDSEQQVEGGKQPLAEVLEPAYYDDSADTDDIVE